MQADDLTPDERAILEVLRPTEGRETETWLWRRPKDFIPVRFTQELVAPLIERGLVERNQLNGGTVRRWWRYRITEAGVALVGKRQPVRFVSKRTGKEFWL